MRIQSKFVRVLLVTGLSFVWQTSEAKLFAIDHMNLATVFLYDGEYEKARDSLNQVNRSNRSFDLARFQSLEGLIALRQGKFAESVEKLEAAIISTRTKKYVYNRNVDQESVRRNELRQLNIYLAEAYYNIERCEKVLEALNASDELAFVKPQLYAVRAECNWNTGFHDFAIQTLNDGYRKFPDAIQLMKQKFAYLAEGGLYTSAAEMALKFLERDDLVEADYLSFARVLDGAGQSEKAMELLHEARKKYPKNSQIPLFIGHIYLDRGEYFTAAGLFEQAARLDPVHTVEAAEVYRRALEFPTSLRLNSHVADTGKKLIQKIALYIELEEFERVVALEPDLKRSALLSDENIRYALAYAYFRLGEFNNTESHLSKLKEGELIQKAAVIRQNIIQCRKDILACEQ